MGSAHCMERFVASEPLKASARALRPVARCTSTNCLTNSLFGRATQAPANFLGARGANGDFNPLYQIGGPRSIQLALKLQF